MKIKTIVPLILLLFIILPVTSSYAYFTSGVYWGTVKGVYHEQSFTTGYRYTERYNYKTYWYFYIDRETQTLYIYEYPLHIQHIRESSRYVFIKAVNEYTGYSRDGKHLYKEKVVVTMLLYGEDYGKCKLSFYYRFSVRDTHTGKLLYIETMRGIFRGENTGFIPG